MKCKERKKISNKKGGVKNKAHCFLIALTLKRKTQWLRSLFRKETVLSACVPGEVCKKRALQLLVGRGKAKAIPYDISSPLSGYSIVPWRALAIHCDVTSYVTTPAIPSASLRPIEFSRVFILTFSRQKSL